MRSAYPTLLPTSFFTPALTTSSYSGHNCAHIYFLH